MPDPTGTDHTTITNRIGYELLGPAVQRWLAGLYSYIDVNDWGDTPILFCGGAGARTKSLYETFRAGESARRETGNRLGVLPATAYSANLGTFKRITDNVTDGEHRQLYFERLTARLSTLLSDHPSFAERRGIDVEEFTANVNRFDSWIGQESPTATAIRDYLYTRSAAFEAEVETALEGSRRALLIICSSHESPGDTLRTAFGEVAWHELTFDAVAERSGTGANMQASVMPVVGKRTSQEALSVCGTILDTALRDPKSHGDGADTWQVSLRDELDRYLANHRQSSIAAIENRYFDTAPARENALLYPCRSDALGLIGQNGSDPFETPFDCPVLSPVTSDADSYAELRVQTVLWPHGQAALEYDPVVAREVQERLVGARSDATYFDPRIAANAEAEPTSAERPIVAIITRTKNRNVLLRRAAQSVSAQTYDNYIWVVVNDGGDEAAVRRVIEESTVDRRKSVLVSNAESLGMEAASNLGIRNCTSDYVLIHDDDDSLAPEFLERTVAFLEGHQGVRYGGVITKSLYVSEEIQGERVIEYERRPYQDWVRNVHLAEMFRGNFFAPIAFIYRRAVWDDIGGYNETLPVLGDWYFNLEFLMRENIGIIHEPLAYYHHRDRTTSGGGNIYSNSVVGGISKHEEYNAIIRNEFIRNGLGSDATAVAAIAGFFGDEMRFRQLAQDLKQTAEKRLGEINELIAISDERLRTIESLDSERLELYETAEKRLADVNELVALADTRMSEILQLRGRVEELERELRRWENKPLAQWMKARKD